MFHELTPEEVMEYMGAGRMIDYVADLEVTIEQSDEISSEHKYYKCVDGPVDILEPFELSIVKIEATQAELKVEAGKDSEIFNTETRTATLKPGDGMEVEFGISPFTSVCQVKLARIRAGEIREL